MPKMQIVTDEMLKRADSIGINANAILDSQQSVTNIFQNIGRDFSGRVPTLMNQHIIAMNSDYQAMNGILTSYKDFLADNARNYEWTEDELARWAGLLGTAGATGATAATVNNTPSETSTSSQTSNDSPISTPTSTPSPEPVATTVDNDEDNDEWGWNTKNLPFSHNAPQVSVEKDSSSAAYTVSNSSVKVNTRELYNDYAKGNRVNCVYYARARYLEVNGLENYPFSTSEKIKESEYIKNGNCVVRFNGHSVYVEHYDADNDVVWFSDSNMASHKDGALQSMSFEDFKNFKGGFQYVEGHV